MLTDKTLLKAACNRLEVNCGLSDFVVLKYDLLKRPFCLLLR